MVTKIIQNEPYYLEVIITDVNGYGVPGLVIEYYIYKSSTNILVESGNMIDITDGIYQKQIVLANLGQYRVLYKTPHRYANSIETLIVVEEITDDLSGITTKLNRLLGLCQENYRIFNPVYDNRSNLLSGLIKIYPSTSDVDADTNAIASYSITATYNTQNQMTSYKVKKI